MRSAFVALAIVAVAAAAAGQTIPSVCDGVTAATATTTWDVKCSNLTSLGDAACWSNGVPSANSTVLFPADTNATMGTWHNSTWALPYIVLRARNIILAAGATLTLTGDGIEVSQCFLVGGTLSLVTDYYPNGYYEQPGWTQAPVGAYLPDPAQPLGTDCATVPVGFTPRVCGPGTLVVEAGGLVNPSGLYASVFMSGVVMPGANFTLQSSAFLWGNITNWGTYTTQDYTYQHGYLYNKGLARLDTIAFDKWATTYVANTNHPLLIENSGTLNIGGLAMYPTQADNGATGGVYRVSLVNLLGGQATINLWLAPFGLDCYNLGVLTFRTSNWEYGFEGDGTYLNRGTMVADGQEVFLNTYMDEGGTLRTVNGGSFNFVHGSPNEAARATMRLCSLVSSMPSTLQARYKENMRKRDIAARAMTQDERHLVAVSGSDGCTWYCGHCYLVPYSVEPPLLLHGGAAGEEAERKAAAIFAAAGVSPDFSLDGVDATGLPLHRHGGDVKLHIQRALADHVVPTNPCGERRFTFANTTIESDGTGAVVTTVPVEIRGTVELGVGAKWHVAAERGIAPFFGGGALVVKKGAALFTGIEAALSHHGTIRVMRGGLFAVPRHARIAVTNHTLQFDLGSKLHVDGRLTLAEARGARLAVDQCGQVDGIGEVIVDRDGLLGCARDPAALHKPVAADAEQQVQKQKKDVPRPPRRF